MNRMLTAWSYKKDNNTDTQATITTFQHFTTVRVIHHWQKISYLYTNAKQSVNLANKNVSKALILWLSLWPHQLAQERKINQIVTDAFKNFKDYLECLHTRTIIATPSSHQSHTHGRFANGLSNISLSCANLKDNSKCLHTATIIATSLYFTGLNHGPVNRFGFKVSFSNIWVSCKP